MSLKAAFLFVAPLAQTPTPAQQIALEQASLRRQLARCQPPHQAGEDALIQRRYYAPNTPIPRLADSLGWRRRHLERRFGQHFGVSPKPLARLARLQHSLRHGPHGYHVPSRQPE